MAKTKQLKEIITKHKINKGLLAVAIGLGHGSFSEKLSEKRKQYLTESQLEASVKYINNLGQEFVKFK